MNLDPESAPQLGKAIYTYGDLLQGTPANGSSEEDLPNNSAAEDLPAGAGAKVQAMPVSDRRQRQLAAWAAAIEDRTDVEAFLEILQIKDPAYDRKDRPRRQMADQHD